MVYCRTCGAQIHEQAVICPRCGCATDVYVAEEYQPRPRKRVGLIVFWIVFGVVTASLFLMCGIIATRKPEFKLKELEKAPSAVNMLFRFGVPDETRDGKWVYTDDVEFYGATMKRLVVDLKENTYEVYVYDEDDRLKLAKKLDKECDFDARDDSYCYLTYNDLELKALNNCSYVKVEQA